MWPRRHPTFDDQLDVVHDIAKAVKRHVDAVDETVVVIGYTCEHCAARWTETSVDYNGGCCAEDERHNPAPERR
jgi:hypothetical protein